MGGCVADSGSPAPPAPRSQPSSGRSWRAVREYDRYAVRHARIGRTIFGRKHLLNDDGSGERGDGLDHVGIGRRVVSDRERADLSAERPTVAWVVDGIHGAAAAPRAHRPAVA